MTHSYNPLSQLVAEFGIQSRYIDAVLKLLSEGNTIPFIARYRKEATGNLDEVKIREIQERVDYLVELDSRRHTILKSIESLGKLTPELKNQILQCTTKNTLEDLYLPYKPKRRTRAAIAREKGLEPLALLILQQPLQGSPEEIATTYLDEDKGVLNESDALNGARDIAAEIISENSDVRAYVRDSFAKNGIVVSQVIEGKEATPTKFEQYYDYREKVTTIPSHRYLAIRRGENEDILQFHIELDQDPVIQEMQSMIKHNKRSPFAQQLELALLDAYKRLILPSVETDIRVDLKLTSDRAAVEIFAQNLRNLLLSSPLGGKNVIGIDPGIRTGCKCAAVDETGKYFDTVTIYPSQGERSLEKARHDFLEFVIKYQPYAIGIGNGTGGRETELFVRQLLIDFKLQNIIVVQVNEAGASVYSASDIAREEFPDLDLTIRGAISIARRLQDPLAELVKVDPKAIGVGQYQHDVFQPLLQSKLTEVVESCVNHVGVELNTASAPLLSNVAGIGASLAIKIVKHRETHGPFKSREQLLAVAGLGPRTFEQAAGFLRVRGGSHPLDSSAVHPERYGLVEHIAKDMGVSLEELISNGKLVDSIEIKRYVGDSIGELTLKDIIAELKKPGRDPRASFEKPCFRDDVNSIKDLKPGMKLDGIITNVTAFGAFVDIGVHQDGLIHVSELSDHFVKDANTAVQVGDKIQVRVLTVDIERKRISLTAKSEKETPVKEVTEKKLSHQPKNIKASFNSSPFAGL